MYPIAENETERLTALRRLGIFRHDFDPAVAKITALARHLFGVASANVSLVEESNVCFKATGDAPNFIVDRSSAFCKWTILSDDVFVVEDALNHPETGDAPPAVSHAGVRFYAGAPLIISPGIRIGALCLSDGKPRRLSAEDKTRLRDLAEVVVSLFRLQQARVAEEAANVSLRDSEARFRHLADNAPVMVWVTEPDGQCSYLSKSWYAFTGQPAAGLGMTWLDVVHPDERAAVTRAFLEANERQGPFKCEMRVRYHDGSYRWVIDAAAPRFDDRSGKFLGYVGSVIDISDQKETEAALRASESRLRLALATTKLGLWDVDLTTEQRRWSYELKEILGLDATAKASREVFVARLHPDERIAVNSEPDVALPNGGLCDRAALRIIRADTGEERWVEVSGQTLFNESLDQKRVIGTMQDITERRRAEDAIRASEQRLRLALQAGRMYAWERKLDSNHVERSAGSLDVIGIGSGPVSEFVQRIHPDDRRFASEVCTTGWGADGTPSEFRFIKPNGEIIWLSGRSTVHRDANGPDRVIGVAYDITSRKAAEDDLWRTANHDPLTALPNRALLQRRLERALANAERTRSEVALFVIDLDDFKDVNDTLGHDAGDALLKETALRLSALVFPSDTVARLGGDEFAVVVVAGRADQRVARLKSDVVARLREPYSYKDRVLTCSASVGVAQFPQHHREMSELMKDADIALYRAKRDGRNRAVTYEPEMSAETELRVNIASQIRGALVQGEIAPFYQPKVCLSSGDIVGFEALARWLHPSKGLLTPAYFGTAFENAELASSIGYQMLAHVAADIRIWQDKGLYTGRIAVNLSPAEFADPRLPDQLFATLREAGLEPNVLEIEVTETAFIGRRAAAITTILEQFHAGGISVALDDFGTGSASLTHLKQFPVNHLKIDRSFIAGLELPGDDAAIVTAVIRLGKDLGMQVTAEGVETEGQIDRLVREGCNYAQGYFYAKPMAASRVPWFLRNRTDETAPDSVSRLGNRSGRHR